MDAGFIAYEAQRNAFGKLEILSNNMANVNTTGFKADLATFMQDPTRYKDNLRNPTPILSNSVDTTPGGLQTTGRQLDVAISGNGYFQVQSPLGPRYTRAGSMQVNNEGVLTNAQGWPIIGDGGPITLQPNDEEIKISANGDLVAVTKDGDITSDQVRGTIGVFTFADPTQLQKVGNSLYTTNQPADQADTANFKVAQGVLESSNVSGVEQMAQLVQVSRDVQNLANIIENEHQLQRSAMQRIAAV